MVQGRERGSFTQACMTAAPSEKGRTGEQTQATPPRPPEQRQAAGKMLDPRWCAASLRPSSAGGDMFAISMYA